jgi:hypothetical protein
MAALVLFAVAWRGALMQTWAYRHIEQHFFAAKALRYRAERQ